MDAEFIKSLITGVIGLVGVLAGLGATYWGNERTYRRELKKAEEEEKKATRERQRLLDEKISKSLNQFLLKSRGLYEVFNNGRNDDNFNFKMYTDAVRPLLYENFNSLTLPIQNAISELDDVVYASSEYKAETDNISEEANNELMKLIQAIRHYFEEQKQRI